MRLSLRGRNYNVYKQGNFSYTIDCRASNAHAQTINWKGSSSLHPAQSSIATKKTSLPCCIHDRLAPSGSPKHSRHPPLRPLKSSFPPRSILFAWWAGAVTCTCVAHSYRCPTCPRSLTSRPFAVVTQALSAQPSLRRPRFVCASIRQPVTRGQGDFRQRHRETD